MKKSFLLILGIFVWISCDKIDDNDFNAQYAEICGFNSEILPPGGFELKTVGEIDFNGNVKVFQFIDKNTGFAMLSNNRGGYVEVFKTTDGGQSWSNLNIGINHFPKSMIFKDENFGIITVHDVTGCPPPNCQQKCVVLKTENGGIDWEEVEYNELRGILYNPTYDSNANLYAILSLYGQQTLMKSVDDGLNWDVFFDFNEVDTSYRTYFFEVYQDIIYTLGQDGNIVVIDSNGQLINTLAVTNSNIYDLEIIDENNMVVAHSKQVAKSIDAGVTWEPIYESVARIIGFDSVDDGLMLLQKSRCPTDTYHVNDVIASSNSGGLIWNEADKTTTNLRIKFVNSQSIGEKVWYVMIGNELMEIKEN